MEYSAKVSNILFTINLSCDYETLFNDTMKQLTTTLNYSMFDQINELGVQFISSNLSQKRKLLYNSELLLANEICVENIHLMVEYYICKKKQNKIILYKDMALIVFTDKSIEVFYDIEYLKSHYHSIYIPYLFCTSILYEIVSSMKMLVIHASAISRNDKGIMFLAEKGSGKSTFALSLCLTANYTYLADDKIIYNRINGQILTLPDVIRLKPDMYSQIFNNQSFFSKTIFREKIILNIEQLFNVKTYTTHPNLILFPTIRKNTNDMFLVKNISLKEKIEEILKHRIVIYELEPKKIIEYAIELFNQCKCYSIELGTNLKNNLANLNEFITQELL